MDVRALDHVALWVADRAAMTDRLLELTTMHVIEQTERFTLIGSHARRGKLTLFDAEGPREPGPLRHIALRTAAGDDAEHDLGEGLTLRIVRADTDLEHDLDSVGLWSAAPDETAEAYLQLGFEAAPPAGGVPRVAIDGKFVELHEGDPREPERPLLNHLAVLVDSADAVEREVRAQGGEIADVVDAANTLAVFVWTPGRIKLEYVEHKASFSLT